MTTKQIARTVSETKSLVRLTDEGAYALAVLLVAKGAS